MPALAIIGGGPAGLMAAQAAVDAGVEVDLYDAMGSVGRKFLLAGKGGLNLTHSDSFETFVSRYRGREEEIRRWLNVFDADALREFARGLGVETFVGSSGRVFPSDLKAAPMMRGWVRRLRASGVRFHMHHRFLGWRADGTLRFATATGESAVRAEACVLACGGASWPELGSDGRWCETLRNRSVEVADLQPANCGFDVGWSAHFRDRHGGAPIKSVRAWIDAGTPPLQGEFVISDHGVEGSLIYALAAELRDRIAADGGVILHLDLAPHRSEAQLRDALAMPVKGRSVGEHLRRSSGLDAAKSGLVFEVLPRDAWHDPVRVAATIKHLPLSLLRPRPISEAISSAGGVAFASMDENLMLRQIPGFFCAGEMVDWEAPTGGYLLTACFASGLISGRSAAAWLQSRH